MKKPSPAGPLTGVTIDQAVVESSTLPGSPRSDRWIAIANRPRSVGVVQSPAAAISGYVCLFPGTGAPLRR